MVCGEYYQIVESECAWHCANRQEFNFKCTQCPDGWLINPKIYDYKSFYECHMPCELEMHSNFSSYIMEVPGSTSDS